MYLMDKNVVIGRINEETFELTPSVNLDDYGIIAPIFATPSRLKGFIEDRLFKPYNPLVSQVLDSYGMDKYDVIELAKRSRAMKYTDYFWIATEENVNEDYKTFHLLYIKM